MRLSDSKLQVENQISARETIETVLLEGFSPTSASATWKPFFARSTEAGVALIQHGHDDAAKRRRASIPSVKRPAHQRPCVRRLEGNRRSIPPQRENEVLARDTCCVYGGVDFVFHTQRKAPGRPGSTSSSMRALSRAETLPGAASHAMRCKETKDMSVWVESAHCKHKLISGGRSPFALGGPLKGERNCA
jgi:hypothetical protein